MIEDERTKFLVNSQENINEKTAKAIPKSDRWYVYYLLIISNIFISIDHGSIPASTMNLYLIFKSNQKIGLFGSLVFIGNLLGSLIILYLINKIQRKTLLITSMIFISICLVTFIMSENTFFLFSNRVFLGIFQSYVNIYLPLWCNQYGITKNKSIMLSFSQLATPIGVFFGYLIASIFISYDNINGWKYSFVIQSIAVFCMSFTFIWVSEERFNSKLFGYHDEEIDKTLFFEESFSENSKASFKDILRRILEHKKYIISAFSLSTLYFCITGLQYWGSDYMNRILNINSPKERLLYFTIIVFTSPTIGVICGGYICDKLGGYASDISCLFCLILSLLSFCNGIIVPFCKNIKRFLFFTWFALLYGGGMMPILTGTVISSLPQDLQASGNSLTSFIGILFGYLPSPYLYGVFEDYFEDGGKKSMLFNMSYIFFGVILLAIYTFLKLKHL